MALNTARGGAKPPMLSSPWASEVPIEVRGVRKPGIYERDRSILARRVELPAWLYKLVANDRTVLYGPLEPPAEEQGESRGHISVRPPTHEFEGSAVGLDMEIFYMLASGIQLIKFYIYGTAYRAVDVWQITVQDFIRHAKFVETKTCFMPQMMVPISVLTSARTLKPLCSPATDSHH